MDVETSHEPPAAAPTEVGTSGEESEPVELSIDEMGLPEWMSELPHTRWAARGKPMGKPKNRNLTRHYHWLDGILHGIVNNIANNIPAATAAGTPSVPLFVVAGACPYPGPLGPGPMQAVMYSEPQPAPARAATEPQPVDFWFVRPHRRRKDQIDPRTLRPLFSAVTSKKVYEPVAQMFSRAGGAEADVEPSFGIEDAAGSRRAFATKDGERMYLYMLWVESFPTSAFAAQLVVRGQLVYQRNPMQLQFYIHGYMITVKGSERELRLVGEERGPFGPEVMPSDIVKT